MASLIEVKNLKKEYQVVKKRNSGLRESIKSIFNRDIRTVYALNDVSLNIEKGEIRGLIGPNGAGKSTLIKILCGVLYPTSGEVTSIGYIPWKDRVRYVHKIGAVFGQKSQLNWDLPAIDTFSLHRQIYQIPDDSYKSKVDYFCDCFNLSEIIYKPVRQLSLGERMKCEVLCAILHSPELIFLDEPTIGLDLISKENIRKYIRDINRDLNVTFILTTHDIDDIENLCENITIINHGKIVYNDTLLNMKNSFFTKKLVEVTFSSEVEETDFSDFHLIDFDPLKIRFEISSDDGKMASHINRIISNFSVVDLNLTNIGIEEAIRNLYLTKNLNLTA